jgi:hypothetical protein
MKLEFFLQLAGILQILLLTAGFTMTRVVDLPRHIATLPAFHGQLFWTYLGFTGFTLLSLGVLTLLNAGELAHGRGLARDFNLFVCLFWTARLAVQFLVFDLRPFLTNIWLKTGHAAINVVFLYLPLVHGWAAIHPVNQP